MSKSLAADLEIVMTAQETSIMLGVTIRQVQRLCKAGKLVNRYAEGIYLIHRTSAEQYKGER